MRNFIFDNFPFLENDFDALTDYQLFCKMIAYVKKVAITNKTFVDNLDNKLDEMYQNGQLENLITQYLELQNTYTYDSVSAMKSATNLIANSFTRTSGFNSYNDGGGSFYKVREKTSEDVSDEKTLIDLQNNLVAELIIINTLDVRQLGIFPSSDNTNDFNGIADILNSLNPLTLIINGNYVIGDTITWENLSDMIIQFKGLITAKSYENTEKPIFTLENCNNITINDYNVTSTLDKIEPAPAGHVRESYLGSCRIGIKLQDCENIYLNNCKFNNMYWDLYPHGTSSLERTKNIYIKNTISRNASIPLYGSYLDGVYIDNYDCIPKEELGGGNHIFYFSHYSDNIDLNRLKISSDGYLGNAIQFNNAMSAPYNNISIRNSNIDGTALTALLTSVNNMTIDNVTFNLVDGLSQSIDEQIIQIKSGNVKISNSTFNNHNIRLLRLNNDCNCFIDNIVHNMTQEDSNNQLFAFGSGDFNNVSLKVNNSYIKCQTLLYNGKVNNIQFSNCNIYTTTDDYFQSSRNSDSEVIYHNCYIKFKNNVDFSYNGNNEYSNTVKILGCFLYGYKDLSNINNDSTFVVVNSFKNNSLIS